MAVATTAPLGTDPEEAVEVTLLELVQAVSDVADNEREVVATVLYMLARGSVRLRGNFRGEPVERFY